MKEIFNTQKIDFLENRNQLKKADSHVLFQDYLLKKILRLFLCLAAPLLLYPLVVTARFAPDAGSLLQDVEQNNKEELELNEPEIETPDVDVREGPTLKVNQFIIQGNTLLPDADLQVIASQYTGSEITFQEVNKMLEEVARLYRDAGYLARVYLPEQEIRNGVVSVEVVEARFGQVRFEGNTIKPAMDPLRLEQYMSEGQNPDSLLSLKSLERSALIANEIPGLSSKVVLSAGERVGFTDIVVVSESRFPYSGTLVVDNHGTVSTGEYRISALGQAGNLLGQGELFQFNALFSEGNRYGAFNFQCPVGTKGLKAGVSTSLLDYNLVGDLKVLNAGGDAFSGDVNLSYPIIRSSQRRLDIRARLGRRNYSNTQLGINVSKKKVDAFRLELHGRHSDKYLGGGQFYYGLDVSFGDLDLSKNRLNQALDNAGPKTAGSYQNLLWNIGRLQRIDKATFLNVSLEGQFASKNLDSSETFVLGGPAGVRAYPVLEGTGDEGWLAKVELRRRLNQNFTLFVFYDHGEVTKLSTLISPSFSDSLKGAGGGLAWQGPKGFFANLSLSHRFGKNPWRNPITGNDSDGTRENLRGWIQMGKSF